MARQECQFFPGAPATWSCTGCDTLYSDRCIPAGHSRHWGSVRPTCLRCNGKLEFLGRATDAKPFWQMLPHFLQYSLHTNCLIVIVAMAVGSLLAPQNFWGLLMWLIGYAVVIKYGFAILEHRSLGEPEAPFLGEVLSRDQHSLFWRFIGFFLLMGVIVYALMRVSPWLGMLAALFFALALPAGIMVLAVEKSARRAVNPAVLISLMQAVGWPYLLLWLCTLAISAGELFLENILVSVFPRSLIAPVLVASSVYFTLVLFTMLGYVLYQYQHELGLEIHEDDDEMDRAEFEKARALGESTVLITDGKYKEAREVLRRSLDLARNDIELHQHYHKLLMLMDDDQALVNHGVYFIDLLKQDNQWNKAMQVFQDVQGRVPGFQLQDTRAALEIARLLRLQGRNKSVVRMFHNLHKRRSRDPLVPAAYLMVATIFHENLNDETKALALAEFVLKQYPDCPEREEWLRLKAVIQGNATA